MTRKQKRIITLLLCLISFSLGVSLILKSFKENIIFFYSPTEIKTKGVEPEKLMRIGGMVKEESVKKEKDGLVTKFILTDFEESINVAYKGMLPTLFREGQGIVAKGKFDNNQVFIAEEVLAKHDEKYMPKEVADSLKKSGKWRQDK
jgi:cytochrome c-type biogenesis protein CcmE